MHTRENYLKIIFDNRMLNIQNLTINQPVYDGIEKIDKFINTDVRHSWTIAFLFRKPQRHLDARRPLTSWSRLDEMVV